MARKKKVRAKRKGGRNCGATNATKLYAVEHNGKLTVTRCKGKAQKKLASCRRRMKKSKRGVCQLHTLKAHKQRVYRHKGRRK